MIVDWYTELSALHDRLQGASIMSHSMLGEVSMAGYSNGLTVLVNQAGTDIVYKGIFLPAHSYKVVNSQDVH